MILNMNGGRSAGNDLNFKVVGGTSAPSNPKENTIWVNTSTAITSWDFSATEPTKRSKNNNLILYPYYSTTKTENGITFTSNADGTITANGTSGTEKAEAIFDVIYCWNNTQTYPLEVGKTYTLSGCPSGGGGAYSVQAVFRSASNTTSYAADRGGGLTFTADTTKYRIGVRITIASGKTVSNLVFKPQLEKGSTATSFVKGDATGQVWVPTVTSSTAPFNALKKNGITVYPMSAKQYINGAWVEKSVRIYQNGAWVDVWDGHLLDGANKYEDVTGGWVNSTTCKLFASQNSNANGKATFDSNGIVFGRDTTIVNTANKIDLSNYSTLKFHVDATTGQTAFGVMSSVSGSVESNSAALKYSNAPGTTAIDVSSLNGSYYVVIGQDGAYTGTISKVWLEA